MEEKVNAAEYARLHGKSKGNTLDKNKQQSMQLVSLG